MKILKSILNYIPLATFIIFVVTDGIFSLTSALIFVISTIGLLINWKRKKQRWRIEKILVCMYVLFFDDCPHIYLRDEFVIRSETESCVHAGHLSVSCVCRKECSHGLWTAGWYSFPGVSSKFCCRWILLQASFPASGIAEGWCNRSGSRILCCLPVLQWQVLLWILFLWSGNFLQSPSGICWCWLRHGHPLPNLLPPHKSHHTWLLPGYTPHPSSWKNCFCVVSPLSVTVVFWIKREGSLGFFLSLLYPRTAWSLWRVQSDLPGFTAGMPCIWGNRWW